MRCKRCGTELRSDDEFCYHCGERTTFFQRLFASKAVVGSSIAIVVVAIASIFTWMIMTGRLDFSNFLKHNNKPQVQVAEQTKEPKQDSDSTDAAKSDSPVSSPSATDTPDPAATSAAIFVPGDVTEDVAEEMKPLYKEMKPFLALSASYYENGRHAFKWDNVSATVMALYNLEYMDKTVKYGTNYAKVEKKTKQKMKALFGKNYKYDLTYGGRYPDYVFVKSYGTVVYNIPPITGKTYDMSVKKVLQYKEGKYRVIVKAGLVSQTNKKQKYYAQKYTVYVEKDDSSEYGYVIKKIKLYSKKDSTL